MPADVQYTSFADNGLEFTVNSGILYVWDGESPNSNGTNNLILGYGPTDWVSITKAGGGSFNLDSIDLAISWYDPNATDSVSINGIPLTITTSLTTYVLNLNGVMSVNISGVSSGSAYWTAQNIVYDAAPEPSTWALMTLGFAGLGFAGFRASRKSAALVA